MAQPGWHRAGNSVNQKPLCWAKLLPRSNDSVLPLCELCLPSPAEFLLSVLRIFFEKGKYRQTEELSLEFLPPFFRVCFQKIADAVKWRPEFGEALPSKLQEGQWKACSQQKRFWIQQCPETPLSRQNCSVSRVLHLKTCTGWIFKRLFLACHEQLQHTNKLET